MPPPVKPPFTQPEPPLILSEGVYSVIYKKGDDLRQDQFVLQMISLMDKILKKENLDLKLTPYRHVGASHFGWIWAEGWELVVIVFVGFIFTSFIFICLVFLWFVFV